MGQVQHLEVVQAKSQQKLGADGHNVPAHYGLYPLELSHLQQNVLEGALRPIILPKFEDEGFAGRDELVYLLKPPGEDFEIQT